MKQIAWLLVTCLLLAACNDEADVRDSNCPSVLPGWRKLGSDVVHSVQWNKVEIGKAGINWNGTPVDEGELEKYLNITRDLNPVPLVIFDPTGAPSCDVASKIRDKIDHAASCGDKSVCFQGNGDDFDEANRVYTAPAAD